MCHGSGACPEPSGRTGISAGVPRQPYPLDSDCPVQALQPHGERRKLADVTHLRGHEETSARIIFCPRLCPLLVGVDSLCGRNLAASDRKLRSFPGRCGRARSHGGKERSSWPLSPDGPLAGQTGWYTVALLLPGVLALAATVLNVLFGAERPSAAELNAWPELFVTFAFVLLVPGVGGAWEEPGWRGFAVPRLQVGQSALVASLILGVLIAGWHIPLMIAGQVAYSDIVLILAAVVVFNWMFNNAAGSVLIIMLMHAANNTISASYFTSMFAGADSIRQSWLLAAVWAV